MQKRLLVEEQVLEHLRLGTFPHDSVRVLSRGLLSRVYVVDFEEFQQLELRQKREARSVDLALATVRPRVEDLGILIRSITLIESRLVDLASSRGFRVYSLGIRVCAIRSITLRESRLVSLACSGVIPAKSTHSNL